MTKADEILELYRRHSPDHVVDPESIARVRAGLPNVSRGAPPPPVTPTAMKPVVAWVAAGAVAVGAVGAFVGVVLSSSSDVHTVEGSMRSSPDVTSMVAKEPPRPVDTRPAPAPELPTDDNADLLDAGVPQNERSLVREDTEASPDPEPRRETKKLDELELIKRAKQQHAAGRFEATLRSLHRYDRVFGRRGTFAAEAMLLRAMAHCGAGSKSAARDVVEQMSSRYPGHALLRRAEAICDE